MTIALEVTAVPHHPAPILVVSRDLPDLVSQALQDLPYRVLPAPTPAQYQAAALVLVDDRELHRPEVLSLPRRDDVQVVGTDMDDATVWANAVRIGARRVIFLPDAAAWLTTEAHRLLTAKDLHL